MSNSFKITIHPYNREVTASPKTDFLDVLLQSGIKVESDCGGKGTCGKCRVKILSGKVKANPAHHKKHLSKSDIKSGVVLACQVKVLSNLEVKIEKLIESVIPKKSLNISQVSLKPEPLVKKLYIKLKPPSPEDTTPDLDRLLACLPVNTEVSDYNILPNLTEKIRQEDFKITAVTSGNRLLSVEPLDTTNQLYGIAFDLGTTTLMGALLDLNTGKTVQVLARDNPQMVFGSDVISRADYALKKKDGIFKLKQTLVKVLNDIINKLALLQNIKNDDIYEITVVGNTMMTHLFLGLNPYYLVRSPFISVHSKMLIFYARETGLEINSTGQVVVLPNVAAFVGSDILGALIACEFDRPEERTKLLIDLGTNSEIALSTKNRVLVCSTAAGPAFEGAHIKSGMRALEGAIENIELNYPPNLKVIGNSKPRGICGSGLVNIVAKFLDAGLISVSGRFTEISHWKGYPALINRFRKGGKTEYFIISHREHNAIDENIVLMQKDIRELQMAKAAIRAGISVLMKEVGVNYGDIDKVFLAGSFGNYIDPIMAIKIGLLPPVNPEIIQPTGNAAGEGAKWALVSRKALFKFTSLKKRIEYIELARKPEFREEYLKVLPFPDNNISWED